MIKVKTKEEIEIMRKGGMKLSKIKDELRKMVVPGALPVDLDRKAEELVKELGGTPSFKMVKNYQWTTCINTNSGVVHGIPGKVPFKGGDIVKIDVGIFYKGFHTDSAFSVGVGSLPESKQEFLKVGQDALKASIAKAIAGNKISDISIAMQKVLEQGGATPVRDLTGHGVGRDLHEDPQIPCYLAGNPNNSPIIPEGATLAIEVIYNQGSPELVLDPDGWTIYTQDGKIAALFEETIAIASGKPQVLTA